MNEHKSWYESKGVWGGAAAVLSGLGLLLGVDINQVAITELLLTLGSTIGGVVAVFGRIVASARIN